MGLDQAMEISISGINANRIHMEIISSNLANINTTRTLQGGPYRRKVPVFHEKAIEFTQALSTAEKKLSGGIEVSDISEDQSPFQKVFKSRAPGRGQLWFCFTAEHFHVKRDGGYGICLKTL